LEGRKCLTDVYEIRTKWREMAPRADYQQIMDFPETPGIVAGSSS